MTNECVLVYETAPAIPFTAVNANAIPKGTICELEDPMTAAVSEAADRVAGIAKNEKIALDGKTTLACYREGIFKGTGAGVITVGDTIALSGSNVLIAAVAANVSSETVGIALETVAEGETFLFELKIGANNAAYS